MNECPLKRNPLVTGNLDISSSNHQLSGDMIFYPSWKPRKHLLFPTWPRAATFESMFFRHFFSWDVSEKTKWRCMNIHSLLWVDLESLICFFLCFKDGLVYHILVTFTLYKSCFTFTLRPRRFPPQLCCGPPVQPCGKHGFACDGGNLDAWCTLDGSRIEVWLARRDVSAMKTGPKRLLRGFVGDEKRPSYVGIITDYFINHDIRIPIKQPGFNGK